MQQTRMGPLIESAIVVPAMAKAKVDTTAIGYGGPRLRLFPMMAPYRAGSGLLYQPLVIEVELAGGTGPDSLSEKGDSKEKQACWALPIVHEKILMYLFEANLVTDDFTGERRAVLEKNLYDVVTRTVGPGYYAKLTLLNTDAPPLDPKSESLSKQCR